MARLNTSVMLVTLMVVVVALMLSNVGLFLRMNQIDNRVTRLFEPPEMPAGSPVGSVSPQFTLTDLEGKDVSLQQYSGRSLLLVFSSTTCSYCQRMYPALRRFHETKPNLAIVLISHGSEPERRALISEQGFDFPILGWPEGGLGEFKVPGTPFFYLVNGRGVIVRRGSANSLEQLQDLVGQLES